MRSLHGRESMPCFLYWALWIVAILLYLTWPVTHLSAYAWDYDEGPNLQCAALANAGHSLYTETLINKPPLLVWLLQIVFRTIGTRLEMARLACLSLSLLGLVALGAIARQFWGRWAGVLSALILLGVPTIPVRAYLVTSDLPAMSFALLALASVLRFRHTRRTRWVVAAGSFYGAALLIHPLLGYMGIPIIVAILLSALQGKGRGKRDLFRLLFLFMLPVILFLAFPLVVFGSSFIEAVSQYNLQVRFSSPPLTASHDIQIARYLQAQWTLVWLALVGALALLGNSRTRTGLLIVILWMAATVATLLAWSPMWKHYLLFLVFPLVVAAGGGGVTAVRTSLEESAQANLQGRISKGLTLLFAIGLVLLIGKKANETLPQPEGWSQEQMAAMEFIQDTTSPGDFVATDDPFLAFAANRFVPPPFADASYKRILSGFLTDADAVESVLQYQSKAVLFATGRLELLSRFEEWIAAIASNKRDFGDMRAYQLPAESASSRLAVARVGEGIELCGYDLAQGDLYAGSVITVTLFWQRKGPIPEDYHIFVHLLDRRDRLFGQHDGPPLMGAYPTSRWMPEVVLPDPHPIVISSDLVPGTYYLWVGMYRWPSLERLPAFRPDGSRWPDDRIFLTSLEITVP